MANHQEKPLVHFNKMMVNAIYSNSGIFVGHNRQYSFTTSTKTNLSIGMITGDQNLIHHNLNLIFDNDLLDTLIQKSP